MKRLLSCSIAFFLFCTSASTGRTFPFIVSTQWLSEHLNDNDIVVLQVSFSRKEYSYAHLPNATFLWINWLAPSTPDLSTEMPPVEAAQHILEQLGIDDRSKIVKVQRTSRIL
jgi:thiosulfate/3-mercaptopyruvate sulfurtransferase